MKRKILHITPDFNYSCGRSKLVLLYLKYFGSKDEYETHFITNGGDSLERLKETLSVKFKRISFSTGFKNVTYYNSFYNSLKRYIVDNKIELIHTHHRFPEYVSVKITKELNVRTITSAHSFVKGFREKSFKSDVIISVSNQITRYLKEKFDISNERIFTLYNPVIEFSEINGTNEFKKKLSITNDKKIILFMGRINYVKGYDKLINAYKIVSNKKKNLILVMCGRIEDKNFQKLRKELTTPLIYIPSLSDNTLLYQIADLIILPSRVDPFPFVMIEAGINKKPFIGGKTGGIEEFIEDGIDGLLVNPEDENELAEKILYLLNNQEISQQFGDNLYKKVKEKCDYQNYFNRVEEIYNSLLSE